MHRTVHLPAIIILALALLLSPPSHAANKATSPPAPQVTLPQTAVAEPAPVIDPQLAQARTLIEQIRSDLTAFDIAKGDRHALGSWRKQLGQLRSQLQKEVQAQEERLSEQKSRLEQLGTSDEQDDPSVSQARSALAASVRDHEKRLAAWKSLIIASQEAQEQLGEVEAQVVRVRLFGRGANALEVLNANLLAYQEWWPVTIRLVRNSSGVEVLGEDGFTSLLIITLLGLAGGFVLRRRLRALATPPPAGDLSLALLHAIPACAARFAPAVIATLSALSFLLLALPPTPLPLVTQAVIALGLYLLLNLTIHILFEPCPPAVNYLPLDAQLGRRLARRLKVVMFLFVVGYLLFASPFGGELPEPQHLLLRAVYFGFVVVNLIWAVWLIGEVSAGGRTFRVRGLLSLLFLIALGAELGGYRNLSLYLLGGLLGSVAGIALALFVGQLFNNLYDGLDSGRLAWQKRLRGTLQLTQEESMPGLIWLRLLTSIVIWGVIVLWLLKLWGLSDRGVALARSLLTDGFNVGSFHIVPMQWLAGILVFALLVSLAGWMRGQVVPHWLSRTRLDRGVRESMATMSGYLFILLAAVLGLSTAGLNFSSLALIAGALSVGIGFGLQNVVNNFVSGLILLFERPIRNGDWIVVGNTEGYVKRISIRSTQIQTFDRADVIVPNSELIANQVTNWMLRDPWGRVIVPIGVAYGSDPEQVRELLLEVARAHPEALTDGIHVSPPKVLFRGFGDNSLNFELRFFIRNVDLRLSVLSEVNFALEKALRAAGIAIPFPQRDVHVNLVLGDGETLSLEALRALLHTPDARTQGAGGSADKPSQGE